MFSVSSIEPIVSLDDAPVSQTDYQCASAEVCVIEDAAPVQATPVQDVPLTSKNITTSSVANRDAMFGGMGAEETSRIEKLNRESARMIKTFEAHEYQFLLSALSGDREHAVMLREAMRTGIRAFIASNPPSDDLFVRYLEQRVNNAHHYGPQGVQIRQIILQGAHEGRAIIEARFNSY
ncbi:MAG TPA: hypothetical protein DEB70_12205 [Planctomycetaceae bacterium]|nr:hypothetical protein [Planctomycetaceae bacterium]